MWHGSSLCLSWRRFKYLLRLILSARLVSNRLTSVDTVWCAMHRGFALFLLRLDLLQSLNLFVRWFDKGAHRSWWLSLATHLIWWELNRVCIARLRLALHTLVVNWGALRSHVVHRPLVLDRYGVLLVLRSWLISLVRLRLKHWLESICTHIIVKLLIHRPSFMWPLFIFNNDFFTLVFYKHGILSVSKRMNWAIIVVSGRLLFALFHLDLMSNNWTINDWSLVVAERLGMPVVSKRSCLIELFTGCP